MNIQTIKIADLTADPKNARKHNTKNLGAIKGSLSQFGQQKPIIIDKNRMIIAGHGTVQGARALGWTEILAVQTDLPRKEAMAFAVADNRTAELAEWDLDNLGGVLAELKDSDFELDDLGFSNEEFKKIVGIDEPPPPLPFKSMFQVVVECENEAEQQAVFERLTEMGLKCRVLSM